MFFRSSCLKEFKKSFNQTNSVRTRISHLVIAGTKDFHKKIEKSKQSIKTRAEKQAKDDEFSKSLHFRQEKTFGGQGVKHFLCCVDS